MLGLVVGLVLAECLARCYFAVVPAPRGAPYVRDRDACYRLRSDPPEVYLKDPDNYTNSLGFRDREHPREKPSGTCRIVGIGDSFVYANIRRLDDHFLRVAVAELNRSRVGSAVPSTVDSAAVEMILMGVGGYSPANEVGVLRGIALPLKPDLVILSFFVGNDVTGIRLKGKILGGQWYPASSPYSWLNVLRKSDVFLLCEKLLLLPSFRGRLLKLYLHGRGAGRPAPSPAARQSSATATDTAPPSPQSPAAARPPATQRADGPSDWYLHALLKDMGVFMVLPDERMEEMWTEAEGCLAEFDRLCAEAGVAWILLLIPAQVQVDPDLRQVLLDRFALRPDDWDFDAPQRRLRSFADSRGVPVVDLLAEMRDRSRSGSVLYIPDDGHWNVLGNRIAGERLAAVIRDPELSIP
jgi:hypothetical protein